MTAARRTCLLLVLGAIVAFGLLSRLVPVGQPLWDENLGDLLYAVAAYLFLGILLPLWRPLQLALSAFTFCLAVELLQLTGLPARYASVTPLRWLLGTHFAWRDLALYLTGVTVAALLDTCWWRQRSMRLDDI